MIRYFDLVRVINLERRKDRRLETEAEFRKHGYPINTERVGFFRAIAPQSAEGFPNPGVRGCFLSHLGVLEEALAARVSSVLVLEDDVCFSKHIEEYGQVAVGSLQGIDWDIAYFGHKLPNAEGTSRWLSVDRPMLLAHCYAVNGKILSKLVAFLHEILLRQPGHPDGGPMHYDGALNHFAAAHSEAALLYFSKNLAYQRPSTSDLRQFSPLDSNLVLKPFAPILRKAKRLYLSWWH